MEVDCCRFRHVVGAKGGSQVGRGMCLPQPRSGALVGFACRSGEEANDGRNGQLNSPYTAEMLIFLGHTHDIRMDLEHVRDAVVKKTADGWPIKQHPCYISEMGTKIFGLAPLADAPDAGSSTRPYAPGAKPGAHDASSWL